MAGEEAAAFGRALNDVIGVLRRVGSDTDPPDLIRVRRALAEAEKRFVFAHPKLEPSQSRRFRSLFLQARKIQESNLALEASRFATQFSDAWLLREVGEGINASEGLAAAAPESKVEARSPAAAASPYPVAGSQRMDAASSGTSPASSDAPQTTPPMRRRKAWHTRLWVRMTLAACAGVLVTVGIALFMTEVVIGRPEQKKPVAETPEVSRQARSGERRTPAILPVTSLGKDGPVVSVTARDPWPADAMPPPDNLMAVLDWLNARFASSPDPAGSVSDMVDALRNARAGWRDTGRLGALADCLTAAGALATYPSSGNLLSGEVLFAQGGESVWLALCCAHVALRLGLQVDSVSVPDGRPYAVAEGAVFGPAPRLSKPGETIPLKQAVRMLAVRVAERESRNGNLACPELFLLLERLGVDAQKTGDLRSVWATQLAVRLPTLDDATIHGLLSTNADLPVRQLDAGALHGLVLRLGPDRAPLKLLESLCAKAHGAAFPDGTLVAEVMLARTHPPGNTPAVPAQNLFAALAAAVEKSPGRFQPVFESISERCGHPEAIRFASELWRTGTRTFPVAVEVARTHLAADVPDRLMALAVLAEAVVENLGSVAVQNSGGGGIGKPRALPVSDERAAISAVRHGSVLALELKQWDVAARVVELGLGQWPEDPVLWRVLAELLLHRGEESEARAVLARMVLAWPENDAAKARLSEVVGQGRGGLDGE